MATRKQKPRVIFSYSMVNAASLETIAGALQAIKAFSDWKLQLFALPSRLTPADIRQAKQDGIRGILIHHPLESELTEALLDCDIPTVVIGNTDQRLFRRRSNIAFFETDDPKVGEMAATFFLSQGNFRSYAFFGEQDATARWSRRRLRGYRACLMAKGLRTTVLTKENEPDRRKLAERLLALPKPAALMLAGDYLAAEVFDACEMAGIAIPSDISILGVDNNIALCETLDVSLSSVEPDFGANGRNGVLMLDSLMRARKPRIRPVILRAGPIRVVERESTTRTTPSANLVERALTFIHKNCDKGITARDVAHHLGVSSQLLALRFAQLEHRSVRDTILDVRLRHVCKLLKRQGLSIAAIASQCGFKTANQLTHLFKKKTGVSPTSHRRSLAGLRTDSAVNVARASTHGR